MSKEKTQFKPGVSGNPKGRPPEPAELKEAKKYTKFEIERVMGKFMSMTKGELQARLDDPETTMLELAVGEILLKSATGADHQRLDFILNRSVGKVKDEVKHGLDTGLAELLSMSWTDNQKEKK